ncbi:polysaccharide deacetylase family protein [Clostridium kluyveri]|uniref:Polysaccharide deacetylase n=1 Tax=Clostridium kluyveri TaxID=1534 RepID=A0A1L5F7H8_CLOKL|nr:polysaccharide deacetylase family protein [Clostridium kluyveri]APM38949.1 polysaccharide deacetylase [Clostridium kluyveri]UZQ51272.1 polysaccharide deacetylase family protein [Clostridium kluyveri]
MIPYIIKPTDTMNLIVTNPYLNPPYVRPGIIIFMSLPLYRFVTYNILGSTNKISKAQMNALTIWRKCIVQLARKHPNEMYINGPTIENNVGLTFDDGPDSSVTPRVLDILKSNDVKANFFFVGTQINYFPNIVKRAYDEGHLILNHSWNHLYFTKIDIETIREEIILTENKINDIIGKRPALVRPPYGATDEKVLAAVSGTNNKIVIWSIDSMDWVQNIDKQTIVKNILDNVRPGDIILMHSSVGHKINVEILPEIIDGLGKKGYRIVDLSVLLKIKPYK